LENEVSLKYLNFKFSNALFTHFYDAISFHSCEIYILMMSIENFLNYFNVKCENHYFQIREDYFCGLREMQIGKKLKVLRSDNGGEFVSKEFENSWDSTLKVCTL